MIDNLPDGQTRIRCWWKILSLGFKRETRFVQPTTSHQYLCSEHAPDKIQQTPLKPGKKLHSLHFISSWSCEAPCSCVRGVAFHWFVSSVGVIIKLTEIIFPYRRKVTLSVHTVCPIRKLKVGYGPIWITVYGSRILLWGADYMANSSRGWNFSPGSRTEISSGPPEQIFFRKTFAITWRLSARAKISSPVCETGMKISAREEIQKNLMWPH